MGNLKNYLIAVCSAAILCAIVRQIAGKGKMSSGTVHLLSGLFVAICIISPWRNFSLNDLEMYNPLTTQNAQEYVDAGSQTTKTQIDAIISERTEAYILEKANQMRVQVEVSVELSDESVPMKSVVTGNLTPEEKEQLSAFLAQELGIQREMQIWR